MNLIESKIKQNYGWSPKEIYKRCVFKEIKNKTVCLANLTSEGEYKQKLYLFTEKDNVIKNPIQIEGVVEYKHYGEVFKITNFFIDNNISNQLNYIVTSLLLLDDYCKKNDYKIIKGKINTKSNATLLKNLDLDGFEFAINEKNEIVFEKEFGVKEQIHTREVQENERGF